jgi:hypothetical protein
MTRRRQVSQCGTLRHPEPLDTSHGAQPPQLQWDSRPEQGNIILSKRVFDLPSASPRVCCVLCLCKRQGFRTNEDASKYTEKVNSRSYSVV